MTITLEPGRLALRKPELGGFLIVEVDDADPDEEVFWFDEVEVLTSCANKDDFLPILRPGDVVPTGSLLLDVNTGNHLTMWEANADMEPVDMQAAIYEATMFALLREGPEDSK